MKVAEKDITQIGEYIMSNKSAPTKKVWKLI